MCPSRRALCLLAATFLLLPLSVGCGDGPDSNPNGPPSSADTERTPASVAHIQDCVEDAPDRPCERLAGTDVTYWEAERIARSDAYLDAAALCVRALLRGEDVGKRGACVDLHEAYVADVRAGQRDLEGRLDEEAAGRAPGLAYGAVVLARSAQTAEEMR